MAIMFRISQKTNSRAVPAMKKIFFFLFLFPWIIICSLNGAEDKAEKSELARVAILNFYNKTGNTSYDWMTTSLPDAIFESMKGKFDFIRTDKSATRTIEDNKNREKKELIDSDILEIARTTSSDIIILGSFFFPDGSKEITISTRIYHLSRNSFTGILSINSPVDSTLFNVVDRVSAQSIGHIMKIALEDEGARKKLLADKDKTKKFSEEKQVPDKGEKIVLKKAHQTEGVKESDKSAKWDKEIALAYALPVGQTSNLKSGTNVSVLFLPNWFSNVQPGLIVSIYQFDGDTGNTSVTKPISKLSIIPLQIMLGYNFRPLDRITIEPYIAPGYAYTSINYLQSNSPTINSSPMISFGWRMPIKIFDFYISPYMQYSTMLTNMKGLYLINFGLGIQF